MKKRDEKNEELKRLRKSINYNCIKFWFGKNTLCKCFQLNSRWSELIHCKWWQHRNKKSWEKLRQFDKIFNLLVDIFDCIGRMGTKHSVATAFMRLLFSVIKMWNLNILYSFHWAAIYKIVYQYKKETNFIKNWMKTIPLCAVHDAWDWE